MGQRHTGEYLDGEKMDQCPLLKIRLQESELHLGYCFCGLEDKARPLELDEWVWQLAYRESASHDMR